MTDRIDINPPSLAYPRADKRLWVTLGLMLLVAGVFWLGSRYPSLNEKAMMGAEAPTSGLAFDILIVVSDNDKSWYRAAAHFVNWSYTNWRGMTFGILFGAILVTFLSLLQRRSFQSPWLNAAMGIVVGAPLGVCVNCVAPIAQGLARAGAAVETTLGALVASPMLNVIVLTMSFALLPFYMAVTKIALTFVFVLLIIPLFCRFMVPQVRFTSSDASAVDKRGLWSRFMAMGQTLTDTDPTPEPHWHVAAIWVLRRTLRNLLTLAAMTVPMMLIAGLVGTVLVAFVPLHMWIHIYDQQFIGPVMSILGLILLASFAVLLPVPIAFDVIIVAILMVAGLDHKSALTLLIALGSYSMVAFLIIGQALTFRFAAAFGVLVVGLATFAGMIGEFGERVLLDRAKAQILASGPDVPAPRQMTIAPMPGPQAVPQSAPKVSYQPVEAQIDHSGPGRISVQSADLEQQTPGAQSDTIFSREMGPDLGLTQTGALSENFAVNATRVFRGITAGDINRDGWVDLVLSAEETGTGVRVYLNRGGIFDQVDWSFGPIDDTPVGSVALVDLNNDGWLDLFVGGLGAGAVVFDNQDGRFNADGLRVVAKDNRSVFATPAFGDLDGDGDLDIFLGAHIGGSAVSPYFASELAHNLVAWNDGARFTVDGFNDNFAPGQTLAAVIWDFNQDGLPDILVGEDFGPTDKVLINRGNRKFELMEGPQASIPHLANTTMSYDFGDIDNDAMPEFYAAQINRGGGTVRLAPSVLCEQLVADGVLPKDQLGQCAQFHTSIQTLNSKRHRSMAIECLSNDRAFLSGLCRVGAKLTEAHRTRNPDICAGIPESWSQTAHVCAVSEAPLMSRRQVDAFAARSIGMDSPQHNVLLAGDPEDGFTDIARESDTDKAGWSWSSRFTDLDQDGLQDILVATGHWTMSSFASNIYFRNLGDRQFEQAHARFGLTDHLPTYGFVLVDFDRDGDVDILRSQSVGPAVVHRNTSPAGGALWVRLDDRIGNSKGVGAQIFLTVGETTMRRDIKASGGFQSIDDAVAHFGLGQAKDVETLRVVWPDGSQSQISAPLHENQEILIVRQ